MVLSTNTADYALGALGMVETASAHLNDRTRKYWSKAELIAHVNSAQLDIADRINALCKEYFLTSATTPSVANQTYYSLPPDLISMMGMEVINDDTDRKPQEMQQVLLDDRIFYEGLDQAQKKEDYQFFFIAGTSFKLEPEASTVNGEKIRVHYVKRLAPLVADGDVSEIPLNGHELLPLYAAKRALIKNARLNPALEAMIAEKWQSVRDSLLKYRPNAEIRVEPWFGSFGPDNFGGKQIW